jgi:hypothetical protein
MLNLSEIWLYAFLRHMTGLLSNNDDDELKVRIDYWRSWVCCPHQLKMWHLILLRISDWHGAMDPELRFC